MRALVLLALTLSPSCKTPEPQDSAASSIVTSATGTIYVYSLDGTKVLRGSCGTNQLDNATRETCTARPLHVASTKFFPALTAYLAANLGDLETMWRSYNRQIFEADMRLFELTQQETRDETQEEQELKEQIVDLESDIVELDAERTSIAAEIEQIRRSGIDDPSLNQQLQQFIRREAEILSNLQSKTNAIREARAQYVSLAADRVRDDSIFQGVSRQREAKLQSTIKTEKQLLNVLRAIQSDDMVSDLLGDGFSFDMRASEGFFPDMLPVVSAIHAVFVSLAPVDFHFSFATFNEYQGQWQLSSTRLYQSGNTISTVDDITIGSFAWKKDVTMASGVVTVELQCPESGEGRVGVCIQTPDRLNVDDEIPAVCSSVYCDYGSINHFISGIERSVLLPREERPSSHQRKISLVFGGGKARAFINGTDAVGEFAIPTGEYSFGAVVDTDGEVGISQIWAEERPPEELTNFDFPSYTDGLTPAN